MYLLPQPLDVSLKRLHALVREALRDVRLCPLTYLVRGLRPRRAVTFGELGDRTALLVHRALRLTVHTRKLLVEGLSFVLFITELLLEL